jgi:hypothetical protein
MLTTNQKGLVAEQALIFECVKLGIGVARPLDDERYDLILDVDSRLLRIQCKWGVKVDDVVAIRLYSSRRGSSGIITKRYSPNDIDGFAAYCAAIDACYFVPVSFARQRVLSLRLGPTLNNQEAGIRWARDFDFAGTIRRLGPIAQLGERLAGSQKAAGSSPAGSINSVYDAAAASSSTSGTSFHSSSSL